MPRYKTGDRVIVRTDLDFESLDGIYGVFGPNGLGCPKDMAAYRGHVLTVKEAHDGFEDCFSCNENSWIWCEEMVMPFNQKIISLTDKDIESIKASSDAFFDLL